MSQQEFRIPLERVPAIARLIEAAKREVAEPSEANRDKLREALTTFSAGKSQSSS